MNRTSTDVANICCDMILDQAPLRNLETDLQPHGKMLRRNYAEAVATVISEGSWNEAKTRAELSELARPDYWKNNESGNQYLYPYPTDALKILEINDRPVQEVFFEVESISNIDGNGTVLSRQKVIVCNICEKITIRYMSIIDAQDFSPHLAKAVAIELGQRCIMKARNSASALQVIKDMYKDTTIGSSSRRGGFQIASRDNKPQRRVGYPSTGARARAGIV